MATSTIKRTMMIWPQSILVADTGCLLHGEGFLSVKDSQHWAFSTEPVPIVLWKTKAMMLSARLTAGPVLKRKIGRAHV